MPPTVEEPELGPSLAASFDDPLLLTVAAPPGRTRYLEDEGYTLARDAEGILAFVTDSAGDLGFGVSVDGVWYHGEPDWHRPAVIHHVSADALLYDFEPLEGVIVEVRLVVATSRVAVLQVVLRETLGRRRAISLLPWLRRCGGGRYEDPMPAHGGVRMSHAVAVEFMQEVLGPGTYLEEVADTLVAPGWEPSWVGLADCSGSVTEDFASLTGAGQTPEHRVAMLGLPIDLTLHAGAAREVTLLRGAVAMDRAPEMDGELASAQLATPAALLTEAAARSESLPSIEGLGGGAALVYRSSHLLLEQLMMPAEGQVAHDYYVFSREPTWWFARLGQHTHESLAMILLAHRDPERAMGSHRIFMENVGINGYLPYSIGPVVMQTHLGTASSPFFSYVAWEIGKVTGDASFVADAYVAGSKIHDFWRSRRDQDGDGLAEWG
ncbi:MAG: hypothetical protein RBU30_27795, partial [Polyangia bacterium]|nr:hypothetical protein [Polyangia bacterium]